MLHLPSSSSMQHFCSLYWKQRLELREHDVLGVCRLTRAQAAICHPTLASLILILSPAWPSRPAVSSSQKGFLLGGVVGRGGLGRQRQGGELWELRSSTARPFDLVLWPDGADGADRQHRVYSSLLSATQTPGADGDTGGGGGDRKMGGWWVNEHNEETNTKYAGRHPPSTFIIGYGSLYSLLTGCCPLPISQA